MVNNKELTSYIPDRTFTKTIISLNRSNIKKLK